MGKISSKIRYFYPSNFYHIYNRGNHKAKIFNSKEDCERFLSTMYRYLNRYHEISLYAYCLMPNHYHLLIRSGSNPQEISKFMHGFMTSYVKFFNKKYDRKGHLFQDRYQCKHILELAGVFQVYNYIKENPVEAGIVETSEKYKWLWLGDFCSYKSEMYELSTGKPVSQKSF